MAPLALAGAAVALPALAHLLIHRRLRAPEAPRWGRAHRFAGRRGPVVFQQLGSGPALVLLHAFGPGFDGEQWRAVAEELAPRFQIYAPDLPGWGRSAAAAQRPEVCLDTLAGFLDSVVREPAVLVAAGDAAPYAVQLAALYPAQVRALALVAPAGLTFAADPDGPAGADAEAPCGGRGAARLAVAGMLRVPLLRATVLDALTSRAALDHSLRTHVYAAAERVDAALIERLYRRSHLPSHRETLAAFWRGDLDLPADAVREAWRALHGLGTPVWIARGGTPPATKTAGVASGAAGGAANGTRDARLDDRPAMEPALEVVYLPGSGSLPHAEEPLAFSRALSGFLDRLPAEGRS